MHGQDCTIGSRHLQRVGNLPVIDSVFDMRIGSAKVYCELKSIRPITHLSVLRNQHALCKAIAYLYDIKLIIGYKDFRCQGFVTFILSLDDRRHQVVANALLGLKHLHGIVIIFRKFAYIRIQQVNSLRLVYIVSIDNVI